MFRQIFLTVGTILLAAMAARSQPIIIDGVIDRTTYTDSATFRVQTNAGFTYVVTLNGVPVPAGVSNRITRMDYYDLAVTRSNTAPAVVTNTLVRFHVLSSQRGPSERGLSAWLPYPPISSTAAEFAGANLEIVAPKDFPQGLEIPIIARVADSADNERRVNGWVSAPGFEANAFRLLRGHGHGFLPAVTNSGTISYNAQIGSLQSNKQINIEPSTTWTSVSGALAGTNIWGTNSRISVTGHISVASNSLLRVLEGAVVRCMPGVTITNLGRIWIEGTTERPVVFTATNRVAPEVKAGAWGGFWMRTNGPTVEFIANGAIMTGSGAASGVSFAPGGSHKPDQPLLFLQSTNGGHAHLTNCYLINNAGQIANGYNFDTTYDHCLLQRAITAGESVGGTIILNHSAVIEFPAIDGVVNPTISEGDYDAIYFTLGTHILQNSLFGFCKDDAIDSGSGGAGTVVLSNCWVESALHEALAWSGGGRQTWTYDSVLMNSGQGIECGWSTGANSPLCFASNMLSLANSIGARYGDNYTTADGGLGDKTGHLTVSNSYLLYNYRDVFGRPWDTTWNWRTNDMDVFNNFLTAPNPFHPNNSVWNPAADGTRLAGFMTTPPNAPVGIGLALWNLRIAPADLTNGIPVRLSSFTTNSVSVDYVIETPGAALLSGTLTFMPGETVKSIFVAPASLGGATTYRVLLQNPQGGELTDARAAYALPAGIQNATLLGFGSPWKYLDNASEQGTAWRGTNFPDSAWSNGVARLGFGPDAAATTTIRRYVTGTSGPQVTNFYFRTTFVTTNPSAFSSVEFHYQRDDGCIVYLNGNQIFTNNMPLPPITANTFASTTIGNAADTLRVWTNSISPTTLLTGTNLLAVEVHQSTATSSDIAWECEVVGVVPAPGVSISAIRFGPDLMLNWTAVGYFLEQADEVTGPWTVVPAARAPATIELSAARKFYRLKK